MKGKSDTGRIRLPKGETANERAKRFAEPHAFVDSEHCDACFEHAWQEYQTRKNDSVLSEPTIRQIMASPNCKADAESPLTFDQFCQNIIAAWARPVDNDEPINGADAVDYIVKLVADCRDILDRRAIVGAGKKG